MHSQSQCCLFGEEEPGTAPQARRHLPLTRRQTTAAALLATLNKQLAQHCHGELAVPGRMAGV